VQRNAAVRVGLGVIRPKPNGLIEASEGLLKPAQGPQCDTAVIMGDGVSRIRNYRPIEELDGSFVFAHLMRDETKQLVGIRIVGLKLKNPAVERVGLHKL
jgi:hypothetical protein